MRYEARDVEYRRDGELALLARVYRPDGAGPFPAVVSVHGGAWTSGDRLNNAAIDGALAAAGVVVLALDFRMPPQAGYPAAVQDIHYAIRWLKAHAAELGTRPEMAGGVGSSSGANTLLLAALRADEPRYAALPLAGAPGVTAELAFVVACWPIADPPARYRMVRERGNAKLVAAHDAYWGDERAMDDGSPQRLLEAGAHGALPPLLVVQGRADDNVTPEMADRFVAAYRAAGGDAELRAYAAQGHSFIKEPLSDDARDALGIITEFVVRRGRREALAP